MEENIKWEGNRSEKRRNEKLAHTEKLTEMRTRYSSATYEYVYSRHEIPFSLSFPAAVCLFVCLSVCMSVCLSVCLSAPVVRFINFWMQPNFRLSCNHLSDFKTRTSIGEIFSGNETKKGGKQKLEMKEKNPFEPSFIF